MTVILRGAVLLVALLCSMSVVRAENRRDAYSEAVSAYQAQDWELASKLLNGLIDRGTDDPRIYYYRGLVQRAQGNQDAARADFEAGALAEATGKSRADIGKSLEKVQGPARSEIELIRKLAHRDAAMKADKYRRQKALQNLLAEATNDYLDGRHQVAKEKLDKLTQQLTDDPRAFYFRGLAAQALGDTDAAKNDFQTAVTLETLPSNRTDVDRALLRVQGPARDALEVERRDAVQFVRAKAQQERKQLIASLVNSRRQQEMAANAARQAIAEPPVEPSVDPKAEPIGATPSPPNVGKNPPPAVSPETPVVLAESVPINFAYLSDATEVVVQIRLRDLWKSPLVAALKVTPQAIAGLEQMKTATGLTPDDIETVTIGLGESSVLTDAVGPFGVDPATVSSKVVVVIRSRTAIDPDTIVKGGLHEKTEVLGKTYYKATDETHPSIYLPDSKTAVLALEAGLAPLMDQDGTAIERAEFGFVDTSKHIVLAVAPKDPEAVKSAIPADASGNADIDALAKAVSEASPKGGSFSLHLSKGIEIDLRLRVADADAAMSIATAMAPVIDIGKASFGAVKLVLPEAVGTAGDAVLDSIKASATDDIFAVSVLVSEATIEQLSGNLPELLKAVPLPAGLPGLPGN